MLRGARLSFIVSVPLVWAGCATNEAANPFRPGGVTPENIRIEIENQGFNDVRIYAVSVAGNQLLGQVPGKATRNFTLRWQRLDDVRLRMDFLAGDTHDSNVVDAAPGDQLRLVIPIDPRGAFLRRR